MLNVKSSYQNLGKFLIILYLLLFPLGQILRFGFERNMGNLQDSVVLLTLPFYFSKITVKPRIDIHVRFFFVVALMSLILSAINFGLGEIFYGTFYFVRLVSYYALGVLVYNLIRLKVYESNLLLKILILISVIVGVFGWLQYVFKPNLVFLKYMNWDDHLFRLVGTFLDPGFTGLFFALGFILAFFYYLRAKKLYFGLVALFLLLSLLFTYSRASYVALFVGLIPIIMKFKINKKIFVTLLVIVTLFLILPKLAGEGTKLLRTQSIKARISNYQETLTIVKKYPLFGVGLNNLCNARTMYFEDNVRSHACSGTDSSLLFVLATTGIVGFMVYINLIINAWLSLVHSQRNLILSITLCVLVHSLFVNSFFYSFVMGYLAIFYAASVSVKEYK